MKANVPKCVCLAIQASTAKPYDTKLTLDGQQIPFIGDTTFHFLGAPVNISGTNTPREDLCEKLTTLLQKVDATLLSRQQKLLLYKMAIIPRLTWDISISDVPISWLQNTLQPIAARFLKRWSGLARSADPNRLFLPKSNGGAGAVPHCHHVQEDPCHQSWILHVLKEFCSACHSNPGHTPGGKPQAQCVSTTPGGGGGHERGSWSH